MLQLRHCTLRTGEWEKNTVIMAVKMTTSILVYSDYVEERKNRCVDFKGAKWITFCGVFLVVVMLGSHLFMKQTIYDFQGYPSVSAPEHT